MAFRTLTLQVKITEHLYDSLSESEVDSLDEAVSAVLLRAEQLVKEEIGDNESVYLQPVWS